MDKINYSPQVNGKGIAAIQRLATTAKVSKDVANCKDWLKKQAMWQIYLPAPRYIPRKKFDIFTTNEVHQADLLFLPHDKVRRKTYKYALTVVNVVSHYKEAKPLTSKDSTEVANALSHIYKCEPLKWPKLFQVESGCEFIGSVTKLLTKHDVEIRRGEKEAHRSQAMVERFNRTFAEGLFGYQYGIETKSERLRSTEWVTRLSAVV